MDQPADIRDLSARRSSRAKNVELRSLEQLRPELRNVIEPIRRSFGRPQVLTREHTNNAVRWKHGERLSHLLEEACIRFAASDAVVTDGATLSYRDLNRRANQVARHLIEQGIRSGDRVGLLFDKSPETYVAMLAVMKVNAAYVPLDAAFPIERISFILGDAEIVRHRHDVGLRGAPLRARRQDDLSRCRQGRHRRATGRPLARRRAAGRAALPTSSTPRERPAIRRASASATPASATSCASPPSFTATQPGDRVYQGMTIAFDFSIEEIWVPLMAGATLVPAKPGATPDGRRARRVPARPQASPSWPAARPCWGPSSRTCRISASCWSAAKPARRSLVQRWYRPGRRILNSYGPTEATVTATLTELRPDKPVTIGVPLSTYSIVILDPNEDKTVEHRRARRDRYRGRRARARLHEPRRTHDEEVHPRLPATPEQSLRPHLPYRRPRPHRRERRDRLSRPDRHAGQDPRLSHRAERDRSGAARPAGDRASRRDDVRAGARPHRARRLLRVQARRRAAAQPALAGAAQQAARLHGAGLPGAARRHPDDA